MQQRWRYPDLSFPWCNWTMFLLRRPVHLISGRCLHDWIDFLHKSICTIDFKKFKIQHCLHTHTRTYLCKVQCVVAFYGHELLSAACWCRVWCRGVEQTKHRLSQVEVLGFFSQTLVFPPFTLLLSSSGLLCVAVFGTPPVKGKFFPSAVCGDKSKQTQK